jgi:hypothetical protein
VIFGIREARNLTHSFVEGRNLQTLITTRRYYQILEIMHDKLEDAFDSEHKVIEHLCWKLLAVLEAIVSFGV